MEQPAGGAVGQEQQQVKYLKKLVKSLQHHLNSKDEAMVVQERLVIRGYSLA